MVLLLHNDIKQELDNPTLNWSVFICDYEMLICTLEAVNLVNTRAQSKVFLLNTIVDSSPGSRNERWQEVKTFN